MKRKDDYCGLKFSHFGIPNEDQVDGDDKLDTDTVVINGYNFGDRLLDGVLFSLKIVDGGLEATMEEDNYTKGLNKPYWEEACLEWCIENDVFGDDEICLIMEDGKSILDKTV
jgi:hypothetical protein